MGIEIYLKYKNKKISLYFKKMWINSFGSNIFAKILTIKKIYLINLIKI